MSRVLKQNNRHAPRPAWNACQQCGRRLPNRSHHTACSGCRKRAQGRPVTRWNATTRSYSEATAYVHRHKEQHQ